jgi:hypothetical protein
LGELALIGRAAETEIIDRLLGDASSGRSGVLVLTGEAGVGKSALLAYARTRADGMGVLQTAGVQSEAEIEFAALYQLLRPALDQALSHPVRHYRRCRSGRALAGPCGGGRVAPARRQTPAYEDLGNLAGSVYQALR